MVPFAALKGEEQIGVITRDSFLVSSPEVAVQHSCVASDVAPCHKGLLRIAESVRLMPTNLIHDLENHTGQHFSNLVAKLEIPHVMDCVCALRLLHHNPLLQTQAIFHMFHGCLSRRQLVPGFQEENSQLSAVPLQEHCGKRPSGPGFLPFGLSRMRVSIS